MAQKITNDVLEGYLFCKYKAYLKLHGHHGEKSDFENLLIGSRKAVRNAAISTLQERYSDFQNLDGHQISRQLLKKGHALLIDCVTEDDRTSIVIDGLQRVGGDSPLGPFHYAPIYFHEAARVGSEQRTMLGVLACLIADVQGHKPSVGIVFHGPTGVWSRPRIPADTGRFRSILNDLRTLQENDAPPPRFLNKHCQICEFRTRCQDEVRAKDELSLLRRLSEKDIKLLGRRGIFTVSQLSYTFRPRKKSRRSNGKILHQPALQALAIRENKIHVLGTPALPESSTCFFFDMETDPVRGFCYLIGLIKEHNGVAEQHSLWADNGDEEAVIFEAFLEITSREPDAPIFVYGSFEATQVRRLMQKHPSLEPIAKIVLPRIHNVLSIVSSHVYFPTFSVGLKDVMACLGFRWTEPDASGLQSVVWRRVWEDSGEPGLKSKLLTYNLEDCAALRLLTRFLGEIGPRPEQAISPPQSVVGGHLVARVEEIPMESSRREWCKAEFAIPEFEFVNDRAYFDYQRDRVYIRTNESLRKRLARERRKKGKRRHRPNAQVELKSFECPTCRGTRLKRIPDRRLFRLIFDLRFTQSGIRRHVTRVTAARYVCRACRHRFIPQEYLRADVFGRGIKSWAMYKHVVHRASFGSLAEEIRDCFGYSITIPQLWAFKPRMASLFQETYLRLERKVTTGAVIHVDETEVRLKSGRGYVWVFTNLEEVVFVYRKTREADFLHNLLKDFKGVLVSDFFTGYDSIPCAQQKCLIHLIRDFNHDVRGNPWDEALKGIAAEFGKLLRQIVGTIDRYGLKTRHLAKHHRDTERFFANIAGQSFSSEIATAYQQRLLRCQEKLFTFLDHDGVAWNNNNAEHAIKKFAAYRELTVGQLTEVGLQQYLTLLSIAVSCKYQGVSFLNFLRSGELDLDVFRTTNRRKRDFSEIELVPSDDKSSRKARRLYFDSPETGDNTSESAVNE